MKHKLRNKLILSLIFGVLILAIVLLVNFVSSAYYVRFDLTEDSIFTLTPNTKRILGKLDTPIVIKFYFSASTKDMPVFLKNYGKQVLDLLNEYKEHGRGNIVIEKYDPKPFSDAEDAATLDGIKGIVQKTGDKIYLGLAITCLDKTVTIPFLNPNDDNLLEYEITSAVTQVYKVDKPVIGVMSALPVMGEKFNPKMLQMGAMPDMKPWAAIQQLQKSFEVKEIPLDSKEIPKEIKLLLVIHPSGIKAETEYAIDQFIMRGGKLIAFVDPYSFFALLNARKDREYMGKTSSTLKHLFKAWGIDFDDKKVVCDMELAMRPPSQQEMRTLVAHLDIGSKGIDQKDVITSKMSKIWMVFAGALNGKAPEGLTKKVLIHSTKNSCLQNKMLCRQTEQLFKDFKADDKTYDLGVVLTGKFKTAFPDGNPAEKKDEKKDEKKAVKKKEKEPESLAVSEVETMVIVLGDADMLVNQVCFTTQNFFGHQLLQYNNQNLTFAVNAADYAAGDRELMGIRTRQKIDRPFTVLKDLQAAAEEKFKKKVKELEQKLKDTEKRLNELQRKKSKDKQLVLSPEQIKELEKFKLQKVEVSKDLRRLQKELRRDIDSTKTYHKVANMALTPFLVVLFGLCVWIYRMGRSSAK